MTDSTAITYSFVYDRITADAAFHGIGTHRFVLSMLAGLPPEVEWEGCLVYEGESPLDSPGVCIALRGQGSNSLQLRLVEAIERQGIYVQKVYEGGPEVRTPIATAHQGQWVSPTS